jgi:YD repeat-containing protein
MQNRRADPVDKLSVLATITGALPTPANPVPDGGVLSYRYGYDGDGNMTSATRSIASAPDRLESSEGSKAAATPVTVKKSTASFSYDPLDRLTGSTSSAGEKNAYRYDAAGNRTSWARSGATDGNFTQEAVFNDANQLTASTTSGRGRGVSEGVASYGYDGAGNRVNQSVGAELARTNGRACDMLTDRVAQKSEREPNRSRWC